MEDELAAARAALYRPGADDAARERYRRLVAEEEAARALGSVVVDERREPHRHAVAARRPWRRRTARAAGAVAVALVACIAWAAQQQAAVRRPTTSAEDDAPLVRVLLDAPERLPAPWRRARVVAVSDVLDGAVPLTAPGGDLLLVVRCPAADRSFEAVVTDRPDLPTHYGSCGRLQTIALPAGLPGPVGVLVTARGTAAFSAALLQR